MKKNFALVALFICSTGLAQAQFWKISDPVQLGGTVNTIEAEESIPVFSSDSSILYFVRTFDGKNKGGETDQDIWYSTKNADGTYTDCKQLKDVTNKFHNAIIGLSEDGSKMYLLNAYDGKKDIVKGLSVASGNGTSWGTPEKISIPGLDIEGEAYGFHVSADGTTIIISQNGPKSFGEEDLYVSLKMEDGWSSPLHLGNVINSTGFEVSPFLSPAKDTLFFSSNGMGGLGDADIHYSVKLGSWTDWSVPVNLGAPVNSPKFDAYFTYSGSQVYWSSNREGELSDIYTATILAPPPISILASGTDVTVFNGRDGKINASTKGGVAPYSYKWSNGMTVEDPTGIPKGEYAVVVTDKIGQSATTTVVIGEPKAIASKERDYVMTHYFGYNADQLDNTNGKLVAFMDGVEGQLKNGREITIKIRSSASYVPTKQFPSNDKLAKARADNMKKMLEKYYADKGLGAKLKVLVTETIVAGPLYENDRNNVEKYQPFQFIDLSTK